MSIEQPNSFDVSSIVNFIKPNNDNSDKYVDEEKCKECEGICCKSMGCYISPDDLTDIDESTVRKLLDTGLVSIDWWDKLEVKEDKFYGDVYFLRMRNVNSNIVDPSYGGVCCALTKTGCALDFEHRPKGGRQLPPYMCMTEYTEDDLETEAYTKLKCVMDWYPHIKLLEKLRYEYDNR